MSHRPRIRRAATAVGVLVLLGAAECGSSAGEDAAPGPSTTTTTALAGGPTGERPSTETTEGDGSFCASIQGIQALSGTDAQGATPEQVLVQNEQLLDLLDAAAASVPDGAPADVEALVDDYRSIAEAIGAAGGDVDAAYAAIQAERPELAARLFNETAHLPAFDYFASQCGIRVG
jgi:hypothetical protein